MGSDSNGVAVTSFVGYIMLEATLDSRVMDRSISPSQDPKQRR